MIRNYLVNFIGKTQAPLRITAQEAASVAASWQRGGLVVIGGNMYATHQIVSITRLDPETEKDLCDMHNVEPALLKSINDFLPKNSNPNLLN